MHQQLEDEFARERGRAPVGGAHGSDYETWLAEREASSTGTFATDVYRPVDSSPGHDVAKDVGAEIKLVFTPGTRVVSNQIGFVQVLRPIVLFPNERGRATQAPDQPGWALDRLGGRDSPIYGQNNNGTAAGNTHFGHRLSATDIDPAWMYDQTNEPRGAGQALSFVGTSFALDMQHGAYLGGVRWGFSVTAAGAVAVAPITNEPTRGPSGAQGRALELWNQQAANPDPAQRNSPHQRRVPLP
jgi:hypothetical protein